MKKGTVGDYELLIEYFSGVRTHAVGTKYTLLELSKSTIDDFTDCIEENRLVMTDFELEKFNKRLDAIKKVFDFTMFVHNFSEGEINRFTQEIKNLTNKRDDDKIN